MPRSLSQFKGDAIIIGGGWCSSHMIGKPSIRNPNNFYTVDIDIDAEPDAIIDITDENQCAILPSKQFGLIYFECFPWKDEKFILNAFELTHRLLKENGIVIYFGGSDKLASSIPDILKKAGYLYTIKKELDPDDHKNKRDNGGISLASNIDPKLIHENIASYSESTRYYLKYYNFFSPEPFSIQPSKLFKKMIQNVEDKIFSISPTIKIKPVELSTLLNPVSINRRFSIYHDNKTIKAITSQSLDENTQPNLENS